ncbi:MAG TPA: hypothetical protein VIO14_03880 [Dehalococcoidia bacterium]
MYPAPPVFIRSVYAVLAGFFTLLTVAAVVATGLAVDDRNGPALWAFTVLALTCAAIAGTALEGIRSTYDR